MCRESDHVGRMPIKTLAVLAILVSNFGGSVAMAQCEVAKLLPADSSVGDAFGGALAVDGDRIVVGAGWNDVDGINAAGAAYVFRRDAAGWQQEAKLTAGDPGEYRKFGGIVAISGDRIAVASFDDHVPPVGEPDSVYIFRREGTSWVPEKQILSPYPEPLERFGIAIALSNGRLAVGADGAVGEGDRPGTVYMFVRQGFDWILEQQLHPSAPTPRAGYGTAVALDGDQLAVTAGGSDVSYFYEYIAGQWVERAAIPQPGLGNADPQSLALRGNATAVGLPYAEIGARNSTGAVHVYRLVSGTWGFDQEIAAPEPDEYSLFGRTHSLNDSVFAGVCSRHPYVYERHGGIWQLRGRLEPSEPLDQPASIALIGTTIAVGYPSNWQSPLAGAVYLFDVPGGPDCNGNLIDDACELYAGPAVDCNANGVPDECDISLGSSADCTGNGIPDDCEPDCNQNGLSDLCDIAGGTSADCNVNTNPDECDLPFECIEMDGCTTSIIPKPANVWGFGISVAMDGDWAIAVSSGYSDDYIPAHTFVYRRVGTQWVYSQELFSAPPVTTVGGGYQAAHMAGDRAVVAGRIFRRDGSSWTEEAYIPWVGDTDGEITVDVSREPSVGFDVYRRYGTTWSHEAWVPVEEAQPEDEFGSNRTVNGDVIALGARKDNDRAGSVYIYERIDGTWVQTQHLLNPDPGFGLEFGHDVALDKGFLVVGVIGGYGEEVSGAYVYRKTDTGWILHDRLAAPSNCGPYGIATDIDDRQIVISASCQPGTVAAYVFTLDPTETYWIRTHMIDQAGGSNNFWNAAAISAGSLILGGHNAIGFYAVGRDCDGNSVADACDILGGASEDADGNGIPDDCPNCEAASQTDCNANGIGDACELSMNDCNGNGLPDECDIESDEDCNRNWIPDDCEIDCQPNGSPDECDIASGLSEDADADGVPDECVMRRLLVESGGVLKSRFFSIAIDPAGAGEQTAIRVRLADVGQPELSGFEGQIRYVNCFQDQNGQPTLTCPDSAMFGTSFQCARLGCQPEYRDWAGDLAQATLHITGSAVVPNSTYDVAVLASACQGAEAFCPVRSEEVSFGTAAWGAIMSPDRPSVLDIAAIVDKLKDMPNALAEPRLMLQPESPNPFTNPVDVRDVSYVVNALKDIPYSFAIDPCP